MRPAQYAIYKGMSGKFGAIQFNFAHPHYFMGKDKDFTGEIAEQRDSSKEWNHREGAVFVEVAPTVGPNKYDWEKKINFALSVTDMGKIIQFFTTGNDCSIMHDPGAKTDKQGSIKKYLNLTSPRGILEAGCMLKLNQVSGDTTLSHTVPLTPDECIVVKQLLQAAIPAALSWS